MKKFKIVVVVILFALLSSAIPAGAQGGDFTLVILHNNDGESQLIDAGGDNSDFGGVARFAALVDKLRTEAEASSQGVVLLSSGDNFLAGPEFEAGRHIQTLIDQVHPVGHVIAIGIRW